MQNSSIGARIKFLLRDSVLYGGASAVSKFMSIFTFPILTRIFSKAEFGIVDAIAIFGSLFGPFIIMGQDSAVARFFYETEEESERKQIISQAFCFELLLIICVCMPLYLNAYRIVVNFLSAPQYAEAFRVVVLTVPFLVLLNFSRNLLKWTFARTRFLAVSLGSSASVIFLTVLYVVRFEMGILGVFYANLTGQGVFAILGLFFCRKYLVVPAHFRYVLPMFHFGWPYMLVAVTGSIIPAIDRYFITNYLTLELMGIYAVAYKIASLLQLPIRGFQTAWGPFAYAIYREKNAHETYNKVFLYYVIFLSFTGYFFVAFSKPLILIFASGKYLNSLILVLPLVFANIIRSISWVTGIGIGLSKKTYYSALCYFVGIGVASVSIYMLIKPFGLIGVAFGIMCGQIALSCSMTYFSQKLYPIKFHFLPGLFFLIVSFILSVITYNCTGLAWYVQIALIAVSVATMLIIAWLKIFTDQERSKIVTVFQSGILRKHAMNVGKT